MLKQYATSSAYADISLWFDPCYPFSVFETLFDEYLRDVCYYGEFLTAN